MIASNGMHGWIPPRRREPRAARLPTPAICRQLRPRAVRLGQGSHGETREPDQRTRGITKAYGAPCPRLHRVRNIGTRNRPLRCPPP